MKRLHVARQDDRREDKDKTIDETTQHVSGRMEG